MFDAISCIIDCHHYICDLWQIRGWHLLTFYFPGSESARKRLQQQKRDCTLSFILTVTVIMFFVFHSPRIIIRSVQENTETCLTRISLEIKWLLLTFEFEFLSSTLDPTWLIIFLPESIWKHQPDSDLTLTLLTFTLTWPGSWTRSKSGVVYFFLVLKMFFCVAIYWQPILTTI